MEAEEIPPTQCCSNPNPAYRVLTDEEKFYAVAHVLSFHLLPMISFQTVKRLRQVCRPWEIYVASSPRFQNAFVKIGREWHESHTKPKNQQDSLVTLGGRSRLSLQGSPFRTPYFAQTHWPRVSQMVTHLSLVRMKLRCMELKGLIEACPHLSHLTIDKVTPCSMVEVDPMTGVSRKRICLHEPEHQVDLEHPYEAPQNRAPGSGIQSLTFIDDEILPPCTMNHIGSRVHGSLKILKCLSTADRVFQNDLLDEPLRNEFFEWAGKLEMENSNTIQHLKYYDGWKHNFSPLHDGQTVQILPPALKELGIYVRDNSPLERGVRSTPRFQGHLTHLALRIHVLDHGRLDWTTLMEFLFQLRNLKSLKIRMNYYWNSQRRGQQPIPNQPSPSWESHFPHLNTLAIYVSHFWFWYHFDTSFLVTLPGSLQVLRTNVPIPKINLHNFLIRPNIWNLKNLSLDRGNPQIDDEMFQIMIGSLPQIESLQIKSVKLTDFGLIGSGINIIGPGRNLRELTELRSLDLSGCKNIGNPSLNLAICHLTNLTFLGLSDSRVSDKGLAFVTSNVLPLEELQLFRVKKLTLTGVTRILKSKGTLKTIWLSRDLLDYKSPVSLRRIEQDPKWKRIVKYKRVLRHIFSIIH